MASHDHPSGHWADVRFHHFFVILVITSLIISSTFSSPASFSSSSDPTIQVDDVDGESVDPQVKLSTKTDIDVLPSTAMSKPDIGCGCDALQLVIDEVRTTKDVCIETAYAVGVHVKTVRKLQVAVDGLASLRDTNHADTYVSPTSPRTHIMSSSDDAALSATSSSSIEDIIVEIEKDRKSDREEVGNGRPDIETPPSLLQGVHIVIMEPPDVIPRDCLEVQQQVGNVTGVYTILPDGCGQPFQVFCDMATSGGGWTVIQRRLNGEVSFARLWGAYRRGFGNLLTEFWMGLDKMSRLTSQDDYELRIDLQDYNGTKATAEYESMMVSDYRSNYRLLVGSFKANGSAGDSLSYHNHMPFTTTDRDNDLAKKNCAQLYSQGGWWYNGCLYSNLNGLYLGPENDEFAAGVTWFEFGGFRGSLKLAEMKVRPVP